MILICTWPSKAIEVVRGHRRPYKVRYMPLSSYGLPSYIRPEELIIPYIILYKYLKKSQGFHTYVGDHMYKRFGTAYT